MHTSRRRGASDSLSRQFPIAGEELLFRAGASLPPPQTALQSCSTHSPFQPLMAAIVLYVVSCRKISNRAMKHGDKGVGSVSKSSCIAQRRCTYFVSHSHKSTDDPVLLIALCVSRPPEVVVEDGSDGDGMDSDERGQLMRGVELRGRGRARARGG